MHDEVKNRMHEIHPTHRGYILLPVVLFITVIATIAFLINNDSAINVDMTARQAEAQRADAVAQAGLQHAIWGAQNSGCAGDIAMTTVPFGQAGTGSYTATVTTPGGTTTAYPDLAADQDSWFRSDNITNNDGGTASAHHLRMESGILEYAVVRFDLSTLPAGAQINSAMARFYVAGGKGHPEGPVTVHRTTADWTEAGATWETMGDKFDSSILGSIPAQPATGNVWVEVNLTAQVQAWVNGEPNYGIMLIPTGEGTHAEYISREGTANQQPRLDVVVGTGPASPMTITTTGTLTGNPTPANDITRTLNRTAVTSYQPDSYSFLQLQPGSGKDTTVSGFYNSRNFGGNELRVSLASGSPRNALIQFGVGAIPVGARVISAELQLYHTITTTAGADDGATVHRVSRDWVEGTKSGTGTADGATWDTWDGSNAWTTAGGDYDPSAITSSLITAATGDWESWDITTLVQGWLDGTFSNNGLLLKGSGTVDVRFASKEDPDPTLHPKLEITYVCECGIVCVAPQGTGRIALIGDDNSPDPDDQLKIEIFESWGYEVDFYQDLDSNSINWNLYDLAYVSETVISGDVNANLSNLSIGVVNEEPKLYDDLQLANGDTEHVGSSIDIIDNSHYITSIFPQGALSIYDADMEILTANTPLAGGLQTLGEYSGAASLTALEQGAPTTSGTAAGRRVTLPLGQHFASGFNWSQMNHNGRLIVQRAIQWGTGNTGEPTTNLLLVVVDPANLTTQEAAKKSLFESWNYLVELIDVDDTQAAFDTAVANNELAYITEDIDSNALSTKLTSTTIGVVTEEDNLSDEFGLAQSIVWESGTSLEINDNTHYITSPFATGNLAIMSVSSDLSYISGTQAPALSTLASTTSGFGLVTLDAGATTFDSGIASGRRAQLPWGGNDFDVNNLNADGITILKRSLEWAAGAGCGSIKPLLMMVSNATTPTITEVERKTLIESWCYNVILVDDDATPTDLATAALSSDVIYISQEITNLTLAAKLKEMTIGIVNEEYQLGDDLGFSTGTGSGFYNDMNVIDNSHEITSGFALGALPLFDPAYDIYTGLGFTLAPGIQVLGEAGTLTVLATLESGAALEGGGTALGRRVQVPWGDDFSALNTDGKTIMQRAIEWAAGGAGAGSGNRLLFVVTDAASPVADEVERQTLLESWGYIVTRISDEDSQANFDAAASVNDLAYISGDALYSNVGSKLAAATIGVAFESYQLQDEFGLSPGATALNNLQSITITDNSHYITSGYATGSLQVTTLNTQLSSVSSYDPDTQMQLLASIPGYNGALATFDTGDVDHYGATVAGRRVKLPWGSTDWGFDFSSLSADGQNILKRSLEWLAGANGGGGGGGCDGTFRDEFNAEVWSGSDGTLIWATNWLEWGEGGTPTGGDIKVIDDQGPFAARVRDNGTGDSGAGIRREADLSAYTTATLSFDYRRAGPDNANDYVTVDVSNNGGDAWIELDRFIGEGNNTTDPSYVPTSYDISAYMSVNTRVRFLSSPTFGTQDVVYFDNVEICVGN